METVIVSAARLPTGKFLGALKDFTAPQLGAMVIREAVRRAGIDPAIVEECIMGNVVSAGLGQAPARQAALRGGLSDHVAALTINKVCGSGLKAVMLAAQGDRDRRRRGCRGRRDGVDEQRAVSAGARARRPAHGERRARRLDDQRRPLVQLRAVAHGQRRRGRGHRVRNRARRRRTPTRSRATARRPRPPTPAASPRRFFP